MGTVNELCVSSLQTFLCPAVKTLQPAPGFSHTSKTGRLERLFFVCVDSPSSTKVIESATVLVDFFRFMMTFGET
ncbi:hypothetical protein JOB18_007669 [Solea senegalensis]|uniref:Uncharacterized protein n=1 Tax=Solea senegalensis TaxID=28829 RepID=A0AAV6PMR8_SOLSE|nr:hypothetical protein JOB18_007669 [Solea senegalensis]